MQPCAPTLPLDERFVLDGWTDDDATAHRGFAEDPVAARFFEWSVEEARAQPDSHYVEVVQRFQREWASGERLSFAIRRRDTGQAVGAVELQPAGEAAEVSYLVSSAFRGQSLAPRALNAVLQWTAEALPVKLAVIDCHVENLASERVAQKSGFTLAAETPDGLHFIRVV